MTNPILEVEKLGQSIWYDNLRRGMLTSGELRELVEHDGLLGHTFAEKVLSAMRYKFGGHAECPADNRT